MTEKQELERLQSRFISMITHELRSPMNTINGYLDLALEGLAGELNQQQREFIQRARASSEHLYALIEDLLFIARADAGQLRLNHEFVRLTEIIDHAIEELELIALDNEISIDVEIPNDFPAIDVDAERMKHVMRNLIHNALRFTQPGGSIVIAACVSATPIELATTNHTQHMKVQIRDTGHGIAPEYQNQIFERFYQIPLVHSERAGGQGLGLTVVKMIIELHGGQIFVESMPGAGSTFTFTLPI
ncbi:MAG TPA: ATP-binding protein [Ktedonobacteraceae bacterium]|nr:ATP-binding protein [Ktedonobacteraceae bacterium]